MRDPPCVRYACSSHSAASYLREPVSRHSLATLSPTILFLTSPLHRSPPGLLTRSVWWRWMPSSECLRMLKARSARGQPTFLIWQVDAELRLLKARMQEDAIEREAATASAERHQQAASLSNGRAIAVASEAILREVCVGASRAVATQSSTNTPHSILNHTVAGMAMGMAGKPKSPPACVPKCAPTHRNQPHTVTPGGGSARGAGRCLRADFSA
jgi:hypothetical protein